MDGNTAILSTGGTINSIISNGKIHTSNTHDPVKNFSSKDAILTDIPHYKELDKLSENMETRDWITITNKIQSLINNGYENIIVTHGTDTLVYTAIAVQSMLAPIQGRIIFTGAFNSIDADNSDVETALHSSFELAQMAIPNGVYINMRHPHTPDKSQLHTSLQAKQIQSNDTSLESISHNNLGVFSESTGWELDITDTQQELVNMEFFSETPGQADVDRTTEIVWFSQANPGLKIPDTCEILVLDCYHSGTAPVERLQDFLSNGGKLLLTGKYSHLVAKNYASTERLLGDGAFLIEDMQPYAVYVSCVLGLALGYDIPAIAQMLSDVSVLHSGN